MVLLEVASLGAAEHLTIGLGHVPPITYRDAAGQPTGFAVDVLKEAARREGIELTWRPVGGSDQIDRDLSAGTIDLVPAGMDTPQRRAAFFVSEPWWFAELSMLARNDSGIRRPQDLRGKRLALASPAYRALAERNFPGAILSVPPESPRWMHPAAASVCLGDADAALLTHMDVHELMLARPEPCRTIDLSWVDTDAVMQLSVIARRDREIAARRLRQRINELTADGTLAAIAARHPPIPTRSAVEMAVKLRARYDRNLLAQFLGSAALLLLISTVFLLRQRRTQKALQRSESRYRSFFELAAVGTVQADAATRRLLDVNEQFCRITGYSREELLGGMTFRDLTHPDDRAADAERYAKFRAGQTLTYSNEKRYLRKDGESVWVRVDVGGIRGPKPGMRHSIAIVQDITARKQGEAALRESEQRYRLLTEANPIGVLLAGIAGKDYGRVMSANEAFLRMLGYSRKELEAGRLCWTDLTPEEFLPLDTEAIRKAREEGASGIYEKQYVRKDGTRLDVMVGCAAVGERKEHAVAFVIDIRDRKEFEEQLRETQKLEGIGLLAGGIAHDFNNILAAVIGNVTLAISDLPGESGARQFLDAAHQAAERAADLTRQLLAYSGRGTFVQRPVDVSAAVRQALLLLRASLPKTVEFREDLAAGLPAVMMDPSQCQQVVMNLVVNGAEAIGDAVPGTVTVRTRREDGCVCLEVSDTGCGMDEATRERMFDPFFTTKFVGRGLGLSAVQGIVRSLKGSIAVKSVSGQGTSIQVRLPTIAEASYQPEGASPRRPSVVVVDDERGIRELVKAVLLPHGYRVMEALNGEQAIDLLTRDGQDIGIVVLDLTMAERNGDEVLAFIQRRRPELHVIVSSGYAEDEVMQSFAGYRVAAFLRKPYTAAALLSEVEAVSAHRHPGTRSAGV